MPVSLHEEKVEEMKLAERRATEARMAALYGLDEAQEECEVVQDYFRCTSVAEDDKLKLVQRLVEWYRKDPSRDRARLFRDALSVTACVVGVTFERPVLDVLLSALHAAC